MARQETNISHRIMLRAAKHGTVLWKNVKGLFYTIDGRRIAAGLMGDGSSDLIGYTPVLITEEMVGMKLPVFTVIESKTEKGVTSDDQHTFMFGVQRANGIAGVARSEEGFDDVIDKGIRNLSRGGLRR